AFSDGTTVDLQQILDQGLASKTSNLLKLLGNGDVTVKLTVRAQKFSKSAQEKIEQAGGSVVILDNLGREVTATADAS
ncbi:MAG: large subunit ribosomal protein L15, partial [Planctomycetota bacterium]